LERAAMMTLLDTPLASAGWLGHAVSRAVGGSRRATRAAVVVLLVLTAIPIFLVGSTPRPTNLSFEDMGLERIPANTSWGRLTGEMRIVESPAGTQYELHDPTNDARYVIVITDNPPLPGPAMVTGQISPHRATSGNVGTIAADDPAVPPVDEPIWLYLTPAVLAIVLGFGLRLDYPVIRRDGSRDTSAAVARPVSPGQVPARWSGRFGSVVVARDHGVPCSVGLAVAPDAPDMADLTIVDAEATRTIRVRRSAPMRQVRLCRVGRSEPGLEVRGSNADLLLAFDDRPTRARIAVTRT
jgi:hypothetical protein